MADFPASDLFDLPCRHCGAGAVGIYYFDGGCFCLPDRVQALCAQHVGRATPIGGMRFICRPRDVEHTGGRDYDA